MARVEFTPNLKRHLSIEPCEVQGANVSEILAQVFDRYESLRGYVLDDQGNLRKHMNIFVDGRIIKDRSDFLDEVGDASEVFILQALSGG